MEDGDGEEQIGLLDGKKGERCDWRSRRRMGLMRRMGEEEVGEEDEHELIWALGLCLCWCVVYS